MSEQDASDLFLKVGTTPFLRIHGKLLPVGSDKLTHEDITTFATELMGPDRRQLFHAEREMNFSFDRAGVGRFRAHQCCASPISHWIPLVTALHAGKTGSY